MVMPVQKPGKSEQVVETPDEFMFALDNRLASHFDWDLAASEENTKCDQFYTEEDNALTKGWSALPGWLWCNPPYGDIEPWVRKAWEESREGAYIAMLVPASVGSNWWASWVNRKAYITYLNGRLTFVGHKSPYPKDLVVLLYTPFLEGGECSWRWK